MSERTRTSSEERTHTKQIMYLIDTNVISEARKRAKANRGVRQFFRRVIAAELRRGVDVLAAVLSQAVIGVDAREPEAATPRLRLHHGCASRRRCSHPAGP